MQENPLSLEELCLDTICDNITDYIVPVERPAPEDDDCNPQRYEFIDPELFLIREISEKLMRKFLDKRLLCDATMFLFNEKNTRLRTVKLRPPKITQTGLAILRQHKVKELECVGFQDVSIGEILDCLSTWSVSNMTSVNFSNCTFVDMSRHCMMVKITNLRNLRHLNLAHTELNQSVLEMICEDLKCLEKLDISQTHVTDLEPLDLLSNQLTSLSICDLNHVQNYWETLKKLKKLRHLDLSLINVHMDATCVCPPFDILESPNVFPHLISLDLSGWKGAISKNLVISFLETHPKLEFLGLVLNDAAPSSIFRDCYPRYPGDVVIAGLGNECQIKIALTKYRDRPGYIHKALYYLFQLTGTYREALPDMFNLVLPAMGAHPDKFGVQMAATACLYNLTRNELSKRIHPSALSRGVTLTLKAMEQFPLEFQLQKNSLLTLCSDTILQEVKFDRFRCAKLVLDALCAFDDVNLNRMAVAICSILAAVVSTAETSELGARPVYMQKLLKMVRSRVDSRVSDITLKFTLSALWNLTDESAATCRVFLDQGGADLFLDVLKTFKDDGAIETKVLGLLNNIAEVVRLRRHLMSDDLLAELFVLLKSKNIDVSYFAAGIVAHLAADGDENWWKVKRSRLEMLNELESAVSQWKVPESEMVAYRSFKPFFSLLATDMDHQAQLWAVWAIHHVCTKNPKRYCHMLKEDKGHVLLFDLLRHSETHPDIKLISSQILKTVGNNS